MIILVGDHGELVLFGTRGGDGRRTRRLVCFGAKRHYRKDGSCKHTAGLLAVMKPWHRARTRVSLWGKP